MSRQANIQLPAAMTPSTQVGRTRQNQALSPFTINDLNGRIGNPNSVIDNSVFRSCSLDSQEPEAERKKIPAHTASAPSTTTWNVTDDNVPLLPFFYPLENYTIYLPHVSASIVAGRVVGALLAHSIEGKFYSAQAWAECTTTEGSVFYVRLYRGRDKLSHCVFVEIQRKSGCALDFHKTATFVLDACRGVKGKRKRPKIPSLLRSLCHFDNFDKIIKRCQSHPHEALHLDPNKLFPLHWVAGAASTSSLHAEAIKALLEVYPDAARMTDSEGRTPLHHACKVGLVSDTSTVFELLINACPFALLMQDECGFTPLDYAIRRRHPSMDVLRALLSPVPKSVLFVPTPKNRCKPGSIGKEHSFGPLRSPLRCAWDDVIFYKKPWERCPERWDVAILLLKVAYLGTTDFIDNDNFSKLMHAAVTFHLPLKTIDYALEFQNDALSIKDSHTGLYPFMLAAANTTGSKGQDDEEELRLLNTSFNILMRDPSVIKP